MKKGAQYSRMVADPAKILSRMDNPTPTQMVRISEQCRGRGRPKGKKTYSLREELINGRKDNKIVDELFADMGERHALAAFEYGNDPRYRELIRMLQDPLLGEKPLSNLYRKVGLTMMDIVDVFRKYGWARTIVKSAMGAPKIMDGLVEDASPRKEFCPKCNGNGWISDLDKEDKAVKRDCPQCKGSGDIRVMGDNNAKKTVLESAGVLKSAPTVAIQNNVTVPAMEQYVRGEVALDVPQVTEGEDGERKEG